MTSEATHDAAVPGVDVETRANDVVRAADGLVALGRTAGAEAWGFARFVLFLLYLVLAIVGFWFGLIAAVLGGLRLTLRFLRFMLLWLSGGQPPAVGSTAPTVAGAAKQDLTWDARLIFYADVARPLARHIVSTQVALRRFWHLGLPRKLATIVMALVFVGLPSLYVIPRPHEVQVTDDNALSHTDGGLLYLIHALDLNDPTVHREYENEYRLFLGKINPQGLKAQIQPGRYYRLWIVGIRWNYFPYTMYPNILWATEIDANGNELTGTALLGQPPPAAPEK